MPVLLSVCMITYNHEKYIKQALDGVLMQVTDFDFEIIVGEDYSTDQTRKIILEYKAKYADKMKLILQKENVGMMRNFIDSLSCCSGKYIALCEGDDYWTDPHKLQKQVAFLEENPEFSICFHNMNIQREDRSNRNGLTNVNQREITTIKDLARHGNYIYTASCVFKKSFFQLPDWLRQCPVGDYPLHLINSQYGKIRFINEVMGVYRIHNDSSWEIKSEVYRTEKWIELLEILKNKFNEEINQLLNLQFRNCCYRRLRYYYKEENKNEVLERYKSYLMKSGESFFVFKIKLLHFRMVDFLLPIGSWRRSMMKNIFNQLKHFLFSF